MHLIKRLGILCLLILAFPIAAQSQEDLSLKECIDAALRHSYQLQADSQKVAAAKSEFLLQRSQALPQFSTELAQTELSLKPYNFRQQWLLINSDWAAGALLLKSYRAAEADLKSTEAEREASKLGILQRVSRLYILLLQKQKNISLFAERLKLLNTHLQINQALWQSGARTQLDVLQTKSETLHIKEQIAQMEIEAQNDQQALARLMGKNTAKIKLKSLPLADLTAQDLPEFNNQDIANNPLSQSLNFQSEAERMRSRVVLASQLPSFRFSGGYVADGDPTGDGNFWQLTAGIQFPLFQWGATRFQRQKILANYQALQFQKSELERDILIQAEQIMEKLKKLKEIISLQKERLQNAELAHKLAQTNYQAGLITNLEFLTAQQQLIENQLELEKSGLNYALNLIEFYILTNQIHKIYELKQ